MNDINNKIYQFVESLVRDNLHRKYNDNYQQFMIENGMIIMFVEQNKNVITNKNLRTAIIKLITNEDYLSIVDKVINEVTFVQLDNAKKYVLDEQDEKIYNMAIKYALSPNYTHNLFIGVKNNHLEPVIKDLNNNKWRLDENNNSLVDEEKGKVKTLKPVKTNSSKGFSNALILAFIIGSFIGIVFLNIYSKLMK